MVTNICLKHNWEKRERKAKKVKNANHSQQLGWLGIRKCSGKSDAINSNTYLIMGLAGQVSLGPYIKAMKEVKEPAWSSQQSGKADFSHLE